MLVAKFKLGVVFDAVPDFRDYFNPVRNRKRQNIGGNFNVAQYGLRSTVHLPI